MSLFCPKNLWKALRSALVLIKSVGWNFPPFMLSEILINWVCTSSNTLDFVKKNSGVFVSGFNLTFLIISVTRISKSSAVYLTPFCLAYLSNIFCTSVIWSAVGLYLKNGIIGFPSNIL